MLRSGGLLCRSVVLAGLGHLLLRSLAGGVALHVGLLLNGEGWLIWRGIHLRPLGLIDVRLRFGGLWLRVGGSGVLLIFRLVFRLILLCRNLRQRGANRRGVDGRFVL